MDKIKIFKNYGNFNRKDEDYYIFSGLLNCLEPKELIKSFDCRFILTKLKRKVIIYKIVSDINNGHLQKYLQFFRNLLKNISSLDSYHKQQACSQFLTDLYEYLPSDLKNKLIDYLLFSNYKNDRKRGYYLLSNYWRDSFKKILEKAFLEYLDFDAVRIIIDKMKPAYLYKNHSTLNEFFPDEELEIDFELLKLRNKFLIKIFDFAKSSIILHLKDKDPISYIFIMKEKKKKIDEDFAYNTFLNTRRNSLITWYGQMGLWNVILKIKKAISSNSNPTAA